MTTTKFPLIFGFTSIYLVLYAALAERGFYKALILSLSIWLLMTALVVFSGFQNFVLSLLGCIVVSLGVYLIFTMKLKIENRTGKMSGAIADILLRIIAGGSVVSLAVLVSQIAGPQISVIPTSFPAVSSSSLYVLNKNQGMEFSRAFSKTIMMSSMLTVTPYATGVRIFYPIYGIWWGTLLAYLITIPFWAIAYLILHQHLVRICLHRVNTFLEKIDLRLSRRNSM